MELVEKDHLCSCGCGQTAKRYYNRRGEFKGYSTAAAGHERHPLFSEAERERLRRDYDRYADTGTLILLAQEMGRTKPFLSRQAHRLGLCGMNGKGRRHLHAAVWKYLDEKQAEMIWEHFKSQRMGLGHYCKKMGYDDLGFMRKMKEFFADEWDHVIESKAPRQGWYRNGRQMEYRVRDYLEKQQFFVMRSPASKSPVDLIGIRKGILLFIQSKRSGALPVKEWNALLALATSVGATPLMATGRPSGRGVTFMRLVAEKDGSKHRQPWEPWEVPNPEARQQAELGL